MTDTMAHEAVARVPEAWRSAVKSSVCLLPEDLPFNEVSGALTALLLGLREQRVPCAVVAADLAHAWSMPDATTTALTRIGAEADRSGVDNSYHNPAHTRDVAVIWANLAALHERLARDGHASRRLDLTDVAIGLYAAFGHDLLHDGIGNIIKLPSDTPGEAPRRVHIPYRLERIAADHASVVLRASGVPEEMLPPVVASILVTEPFEGYGAMARAAEDVELDDPALDALKHPSWRIVADMLRDADLIPSIGLAAAEHDHQSSLLSVEFGMDLNTAASAETLFHTANKERLASAAGALFLPQFRALCAINKLRGPNCRSLAAAARRVAGT